MSQGEPLPWVEPLTSVQLFKANFFSHLPTVLRSGALAPFLALGKLLTSGHFIWWFPLSGTFFPQLYGDWVLPPSSCLSLRSLPSRERKREKLQVQPRAWNKPVSARPLFCWLQSLSQWLWINSVNIRGEFLASFYNSSPTAILAVLVWGWGLVLGVWEEQENHTLFSWLCKLRHHWYSCSLTTGGF